MSLHRKHPRGRRRANLQIDYPFDRSAYVRWRLRCWGEARLRGASVLFHRLTSSVAALPSVVRRRAGRGRRGAVAPGLGARPAALAPRAPK